MSLTIIQEKSDNGNVFLCESCTHKAQRSGRLNELQVMCKNDKIGSGLIHFKITQCDGYYPAVLSRETKDIKMFIDRAYYIFRSRENPSNMTLLPPDKGLDYGLDREVRYPDEND